MLDGLDNLIEMSRHLKKSSPTFQTIREIPAFARRPRSRRGQGLNDRTIYYMKVRQKTAKMFLFRKLYAVNLFEIAVNLFEFNPIDKQKHFYNSGSTSPSSIKSKRRILKSYFNKPVHLYNWIQPIRHIENYTLAVLRYKK